MTERPWIQRGGNDVQGACLERRGFFVALVTSLFWLNLLRVNPESLPAVISVFWLDFIFIAAAGMILLAGAIENRRTRMVWIVLAGGISCLALLALIGGSAGDNVTYVVRIVYVAIVLPVVFWVWFRSSAGVLDVYAKILVASSVPVGLVVAVQFWNLAPFSELVYWLWGTDKLRPWGSGNPRVYGTFYNANWFGVYSVILGVSAWFLWQSKHIGWFALCSVLALSLIFMVVSGSRTALIGAGVASFSALLVLGAQRGVLRSFRLAGGLVGGVAVFGGLFSWFADESILRRWRELFSGEGVSSAEARFATWSDSWSRVGEYPWFGGGVHGTPHNSYLATLEAFGVVVGVALIGFYLFVVGASWVMAKKRGSALVVPVLMAFTVMAGTAEFFYTTQLMILVVPLVMWSLASVFGRRSGLPPTR